MVIGKLHGNGHRLHLRSLTHKLHFAHAIKTQMTATRFKRSTRLHETLQTHERTLKISGFGLERRYHLQKTNAVKGDQ